MPVNNPLIVGGLLGGGLIALWGWVRSAGTTGFGWLVRRVVFQVTAEEDDSHAFDHLLLAFSQLKNYAPWQVQINEDRPTPDEEDAGLVYPVYRYLPGPGWHWVGYRGGIVALHYAIQRGEGGITRRRTRTITLYQFRVPKDTAKELAYLGFVQSGQGDRVQIYQWHGDEGWDCIRTTRRRSTESIILEQLPDIEQDMEDFTKSRVWYREMGIPHRRGYLFFGPPGNGKSSVGMYLAGKLQTNLYVMNLATPGLTDASFARALSEVPVGAVVLMEDIDAVLVGRDTGGKPLTFSGVLNALDGPTAADGRLMLLTTNHPEVLDPALMRPGRIDRKFEMRQASTEQARRLFLRFFPESEQAVDFAKLVGNEQYSMAELQEHLLSHRKNVQEAAHTVPVRDNHVDYNPPSAVDDPYAVLRSANAQAGVL